MALNKIMEHFDRLSQWQVDDRIEQWLNKTYLSHLIGLKSIRQNYNLITAILHCYSIESDCFIFNGLHLHLGLEDVVYIMGLPIDGKAVTGKDDPPVSLCIDFLGRDPPQLNVGSINLEWLLHNFSVVPHHLEIASPEFHYYIRAFVLFLFGCILYPDRSTTSVSLIFLNVLRDVNDINSYAWGAAYLAHIKAEIINWKNKPRKSFTSGCLLMAIFVMIRVPRLVSELLAINCNNLPQEFPLVRGWMELLRKPSRNNYNKPSVQDFLNFFNGIVAAEIVWQPYARLINFFPNHFPRNFQTAKSHTILICFEKATYHRPDVAPQQFGIRNVGALPPLPKLKTSSRSGPKGKDWGSKYAEYIGFWERRAEFIIQEEEVAGEHPSPSYIHSGGYDTHGAGSSSYAHPFPMMDAGSSHVDMELEERLEQVEMPTQEFQPSYANLSQGMEGLHVDAEPSPEGPDEQAIGVEGPRRSQRARWLNSRYASPSLTGLLPFTKKTKHRK